MVLKKFQQIQFLLFFFFFFFFFWGGGGGGCFHSFPNWVRDVFYFVLSIHCLSCIQAKVKILPLLIYSHSWPYADLSLSCLCKPHDTCSREAIKQIS